MRRVVIMGAGGRDFHNFNVVFRDDPESEVVAFTAAQIPGIDDRTLPRVARRARATRTGSRSCAEEELADLIRREAVDEVVLAYSDLSHEDVMHKASQVLAAGADFRLIGPGRDDARELEAGRRRLRGPDRLRQEPDQPPRRPDPARRRPLGRARAAPDAVRRPRGDARAALRHARGHRRLQPDDRGAGGVRDARRDGHGHVRRRRLRGRSCARPRRRPTSSSGTAATTTSRSTSPTS